MSLHDLILEDPSYKDEHYAGSEMRWLQNTLTSLPPDDGPYPVLDATVRSDVEVLEVDVFPVDEQDYMEMQTEVSEDGVAVSCASGGAPSQPFPVKKFVALAMILCTNGICISVIFPFLRFYVVDLGISEKESGTYVGIVAAAFMVGRTLFSMCWGRFADSRGRIPAIIISLMSINILSICFGLPVNVWVSALIRFLGGATNCLSGLGKVIASELVPEEQQARAMSIASVAWGSGLIFGPAFGGWLSDFDIPVPYLPPMLFLCAVATISLVLVLRYLPETLVKKEADTTPRASTYQLVTHPLLLKVTLLHCVWSLQSLSNTTLFNTWASTDVGLGGLGLKSADLGTIQSIAGCIMMAMQFFVMPPLCKRLGMKKLVYMSLGLYLPLQLLVPLLRSLPGVVNPVDMDEMSAGDNITAVEEGSTTYHLVSGGEKALLMALLTVITGFMLALSNFCFTIQFMYINNSVKPSNRASAQGMATALASVFKSLGPFIVGMLFSWSISEERGFPLNFSFAYICLAAVTCISLAVTTILPESLDKPVGEDSPGAL